MSAGGEAVTARDRLAALLPGCVVDTFWNTLRDTSPDDVGLFEFVAIHAKPEQAAALADEIEQGRAALAEVPALRDALNRAVQHVERQRSRAGRAQAERDAALAKIANVTATLRALHVAGKIGNYAAGDLLTALGGDQHVEGVTACGFDVGDYPKSCRCLLARGHAGLHQCEHTIRRALDGEDGGETDG